MSKPHLKPCKMTRKKQRANAKRKKAEKRRKKSARKSASCKPTHKSNISAKTPPTFIAINQLNHTQTVITQDSDIQVLPNCTEWEKESDPLKTIKDAQKRHRQYSKKTRAAIKEAYAKLHPKNGEASAILQLLSPYKFGGVSRASDITYRYVLGKHGIRILYKAAIKHAAQVELRKIYFITIFSDNMLSPESSPELDVYSIHRKLSKLLRDTPELNAFGVIELQCSHNYSMPGRSDATLMGNAHIVAYGTDLDIEKFKIRGNRIFKSTLSNKSIDVQFVGTTENDALRIISYLFKMPRKSKSRKVKTNYGVQKCRHDRERKMRHDLLLRHYEVLSHIPARGLLIGVGDGLKVKRSILKRMRKYERSNYVKPENKIPYDKVSKHWTDFWSGTKRKDYVKPKVRINRDKGGDDA